MPLTQQDKKVQTLSTHSAHEAITCRIRQRHPQGCSQDSDAHVCHCLVQFLRKEAVPAVDHEAVEMATRQGFTELLEAPLGCRMRLDIAVKNLPRTQFHGHEHVKGAESGRDHDETVASHNCLGVVADEGPPTLLWNRRAHRAANAQVLLHRAGRNPDPEFQFQFVGDLPLSPGGILSGHLADQFLQVLGQPRPSDRSRLPAPE